MQKNKKAFTLVELIVVITILAILATIGFVSFSGYLAGARDTNRKAQLKSMSDALELYRTKKDLPIPDDKVNIKIGTIGNEELIAYQGYIGKNVLETIEYTESGLDPKDKQYFSYYLTKNKKYFQLMSFLEEESDDVITLNINKAVALDYSDRKIIVKGKKLGILVGSGTNIPIQEIPSISSVTGVGYLNVETTTDTYKAILENLNKENGTIIGTGSTLKMLAGTAWAGGVRNSCKILLEKSSNFKGKDGYYLINQEEPTKIYCDMTTDGGGWTRYIDIKGNYSFDDAKECWLAKKTINPSEHIECFNPNRLNFIVSEYMVRQDTTGDHNMDGRWSRKFLKEYPSQIEEINTQPYICKGGPEYMTIMSGSDGDLTNIKYIWLGLSYCNDDKTTRELGGSSEWGNYMNYSGNGIGELPPIPSNSRESTVRDTQMFIR